MVQINRYSYRQVRNSWAVVEIKTQAFVRWFPDEAQAIRWTRLVNLGMPVSCTGYEDEWRNR